MSNNFSNNVLDNDIAHLGTMSNDGGIVDTHVTISKTKYNYMNNDVNSIETEPQCVDITVETLNNGAVDVGISDYGFPMVIYRSALKNHSITLELDISNKHALINDLDIQFSFPGELTLLLKNVEYELKKIHIIKVLQHVMFDDWINILRSQNIFELHHHNIENGFATVMCSTDQFAEAIMKGLGV